MGLRTRRPSPGTLIGTVALVFALTGAAVALPGKNSVDSGDIKKNAVRTAEIKNKQVKAADVNSISVGAQFGSGLLAGAGELGPAAGNLPSQTGLPVVGTDADLASIPIPRGGVAVRDLTVVADAPETRPVIVGFERNNDDVFLNCVINIGQTSCQSAAGARLALAAGDVLNMSAIAAPNPAPFGGMEVTYSYRAVPR